MSWAERISAFYDLDRGGFRGLSQWYVLLSFYMGAGFVGINPNSSALALEEY